MASDPAGFTPPSLILTPFSHNPRDPLPGIIPYGGINLLAGAPGCGKTALLATLLKAFRDGTPIFGHTPKKVSSIAFFGVDRSWDSTRGWFERAGFPDIPYYSLADDAAFVKTRLRRKLERTGILREVLDKFLASGALKPDGLIAVDPLSLFLGGNLLDYDACAVACLEIRDLLRARQLTMIATAHASKQRGEKDRYVRLQDRILGSAAIFGFSDTQLYLATPEELDAEHYVFLWCPHMSPTESFTLTRDPQGLFVPHDPQAVARAVQETLLDLLPHNTTQTFSQIVDLAAAAAPPMSRASVTRYLKALVAAGRISQPTRGLYLRPKPN